MTGTTRKRTIVHLGFAVIAAGLLGVSLAAGHEEEKTLLIWASDQAHLAPDFVSVVDFDPDSRHYGTVIRNVPLEGPGAVGNEPHHVGLSRDGRTLALGG